MPTEAAAGDAHRRGQVSAAALAPRLQVLAAAALFSTGGAAIKAVHFSGWQVAACRSGIAALALFILAPAARRRPSARVLGVAAAYAVTMILFVQANKLTTAASTIFLQATAPLYVLLLGPLLLREPIRRQDLLYMAALALGLGLLVAGAAPASATAPDPPRGNVLGALAGLTWALTIMGLRGLARGSPVAAAASTAVTASFWGSVLACAAALPASLPLAPGRPTDWLALAFLGIFQIAAAYLLLTRGIGRLRALETSLLLLLEPVLNPLWAWLVHGERPGTWSLAGGALILLATLVKSWRDATGSGARP